MEGRAWCPSCAPAMVGRRRTVRAAVGAGAAAGLLLLGAAAWRALAGSAEALDRAREAADAAQRARAAEADLQKRLGDVKAEARGLASLAEAEGKSLEALKKEHAASREALEDRMNGVEASLGVLQESMEGMRREVSAGRPAAPLKPEEEKALLAQLDDLNAGRRFEALWRLQRAGSAAARAGTLKGMADPESMVRYQAAILARDLRVKDAVPGLVGLLSDGSVAVRAAAREGLREIEGTDLGFDPLEPSEAKRAEAVHRWKVRLEGR